MSVISDQYAVALFELALAEEKAQSIGTELKDLVEAIYNEESRLFFTHPSIDKKQKKAAIDAFKIDGLLRDFMYVIIDNRRFLALSDIYQSYQKLSESLEDILRINVYSGKPLDAKRIKQLTEQYEKKYNRKVIIENHLEASILGGLRFEFQGLVIDDTINHTIHQIKSRLTK